MKIERNKETGNLYVEYTASEELSIYNSIASDAYYKLAMFDNTYKSFVYSIYNESYIDKLVEQIEIIKAIKLCVKAWIPTMTDDYYKREFLNIIRCINLRVNALNRKNR